MAGVVGRLEQMNRDWAIGECNGMHTNKVYYRDGTILGFGGDTTNHLKGIKQKKAATSTILSDSLQK